MLLNVRVFKQGYRAEKHGKSDDLFWICNCSDCFKNDKKHVLDALKTVCNFALFQNLYCMSIEQQQQQ